MRPSPRPCVPVRCPRLARRLGLVLLVGLSACGSPSPDAPGSGSAASAPARDDRTQPTRLGPTTRPAASPGTLSTEAARVPHAALNARPQPAASPAAPAPANSPDEQTKAAQAQREAWDRWYAEVRESPEAGMRLYALELWAQQPSEAIDPVTAALVDEDEQVRTRAEELFDQQLTREVTRAQPVQETGPKGGTSP